ncbi:hypothetical protein [Anabaena sp. 90]
MIIFAVFAKNYQGSYFGNSIEPEPIIVIIVGLWKTEISMPVLTS